MSNEGCLTESVEPEVGSPLRDHWVFQHKKRPKSGDVGWETIASQIEDDFPVLRITLQVMCAPENTRKLFSRRVEQAGSWGEGVPEILLSPPSLSVALHLLKKQLFYI